MLARVAIEHAVLCTCNCTSDTPQLHHQYGSRTWASEMKDCARRFARCRDDPWNFLERHFSWLIERGYVRLVRIEAVVSTINLKQPRAAT